jgi:hypothetical protein
MAMNEHQRAARRVSQLAKQEASANDAALDIARDHAKASLFSFAKDILGFKDLTYNLHLPLCQFLQAKTIGELRALPIVTRHIVDWQTRWAKQEDDTPILHRLTLIPRNHFKSSIISIALPLWREINDPNWCILQSSSKVDNSEKFVARHRRIWDSHAPFLALFGHLKPETQKVKWTDGAYVIRREKDTVENTVTATGVGGGIASQHYDEHIFDDLINETMIESTEELRRVRQWFDYADSAATHPETFRMTGAATLWPCDPDVSVYIMQSRPEFMVYKRAAIENGQSIFPERYSLQRLLKLQKRDERTFACQYQNEPRGGGYTEFDETWLRYYEIEGEEIVRSDGQRVPLSRLNIFPLVDPAMAEHPGESAQNAIVVTGVDVAEEVYVLEAWAAYCSPTDVIWQMVAFQKQYDPPSWWIEEVAYQKTLKYFAEYVCETEKIDMRVEMVRPGSRRSKEARIRGLQPIAKAGRLFIHPSMVAFKEQWANFPMPGHLRDLLDACAYGPDVWHAPLSDDERAQLDEELDDWSAMAGRSAITGY